MTNEEAKTFLDNLMVCIEEHPIVADWLVEIADRKTEPSNSEKPNNCDYAENPSGDVWECGCFLDTYCEHQIYDWNPDGTINIVECGYEPKTEPTISKMEQVEPQTCSFSDCDNFKNPDYERCIECKRKQIKLKTEQTEREDE